MRIAESVWPSGALSRARAAVVSAKALAASNGALTGTESARTADSVFLNEIVALVVNLSVVSAICR